MILDAKSFDCLSRGQKYLDRNARHWLAETDTGITFKDNFMELLMLEATGNWNLVDLRIPQGKWNYFGSKTVIVGDNYPDDNDTNSIASTIVKPVNSRAHALLDELLQAENEDGIIQLYLDPSRPRVCPEVSANICTFFYTYNRGHQVRKSFDWVYSVLRDRAYHISARYYFHPEPFFYYVRRLVRSAKQQPELDQLGELLAARVQERIGTTPDNAACLAIRLLICQDFNIPNQEDLQALLRLQEDDGSFGVGWYYRFGRSQIKIGHRGFTATLALEAIKKHVLSAKENANGVNRVNSTNGTNGSIE